MYKNQSNQNLPEDESSSKFWADSLSDGETVIDTNNAEDSLEESSEDETSEEVKRVKEVIGDASDEDITRFDCFNEQLPRVTTPQPDAVLG